MGKYGKELRLEILKSYDNGRKYSELAKDYNIPYDTARTIVQSEMIKQYRQHTRASKDLVHDQIKLIEIHKSNMESKSMFETLQPGDRVTFVNKGRRAVSTNGVITQKTAKVIYIKDNSTGRIESITISDILTGTKVRKAV